MGLFRPHATLAPIYFMTVSWRRRLDFGLTRVFGKGCFWLVVLEMGIKNENHHDRWRGGGGGGGEEGCRLESIALS